ncbi:MAG: hypothetical protein OIN66_02205 [Candidatus Methanoperedens sp.]|nr:hypothetical protein [Candidatus Methanoperedens sp.]
MPELSEIKGELKAINTRIDSTNERIDSLRNEMNSMRNETKMEISSLRTTALKLKIADIEKRLAAAQT